MRSIDEAAAIFLGISRLKGIGYKTLRDLGGVDAVAEEFAAGGHDFIERLTRESQPTGVRDQVLRGGAEALDKISELGIQLVRIGDPDYPRRFLDLDVNNRPLWFFFKGSIDLLTQDCIAVVGTRSPSATGVFLAQYAVSAVRELNVPVVSGLAKGIDEVAHEWALTCNLPTISVLGNGLMRPYPQKNSELANKIVDAGGLLLSEYMPAAQPTAENFVWRNRLQAALATCVIAPEWKRSSGTAHTIRFAKNMGRLTVNLHLIGSPLQPDHGQADVMFEVPNRHAEFIEAIRSPVDAGHCPGRVTPTNETLGLSLIAQGSLF
jgi:DNA processing protein